MLYYSYVALILRRYEVNINNETVSLAIATPYVRDKILKHQSGLHSHANQLATCENL
ncbi:hypothetical protein [Anabaena sp. UHCC 0399]|uniref:hypothetical protein n=1 Tax=Anabaena sp. UHCC 0399 TaxID=3110238 RepID=UPI002B2171B6|nr:hypothetical protein [Anabaena sp. UHCC 0399]MEA5565951.1 hypothetical protein [Anabaena sp. UHCC 0399]